MITTLKITTIFAAIVCISLVGFVGAFGLRGDPEIEKLINSPRIVQEVKTLVTKTPATEGQTSPLVKEAQKFALRIDPPPPPPPPTPPTQPAERAQRPEPTEVTPPTPPVVTNARFDVIATCRYEDEPAKSMVLLDLPAKGLKWFRVGENVEHLTVLDVLDGSVIMSQGGRNPQTIAMKQQQPLARNLLLQPGQKLDVPTGNRLTYQEVSVPVTPSSLGRGNAYFAPEGGNRAPRTFAPDPGAGSATATRQPPGAAVTRQPARTYVPPTRPRTTAAAPTVEQRKAVLDENIADLKSIIERPTSEAPQTETTEEQKALAKLLEILEEERKMAEQQSKVTTAEAPKSRTE